jgi:hypothetical protein
MHQNKILKTCFFQNENFLFEYCIFIKSIFMKKSKFKIYYILETIKYYISLTIFLFKV